MLWLAALALAAAEPLSCETVWEWVTDDVPGPEILDRVVASLPEGPIGGTPACFTSIRLPPAPPATAGARLAYLVELHQRFSCHGGIIEALRAEGRQVPDCIVIPADTLPNPWPVELRERLRQSPPTPGAVATR